MPSKPLLVEFIGLPGAGKSTICRALAEQAGSGSDVHVPSIQRSLLDRMLRRSRMDYIASMGHLKTTFRRHPYVANGTLRMYLDGLRQTERDRRIQRMRRNALVRDLVRHLTLQSRSAGGVYVMDEGVAQRGVSALLSGVSGRVIMHHYANMPLADVYVYVEADDQIAAERLEQRDGKDWKRAAAKHYCELIDHIQQRGRPIIRVSGERDPGESALIIHRELQKYRA